MAIFDKNFYNEASAAKLGWTPSWFGATSFNETLIKKVKAYQKEHGLAVDGLVGPMTWRVRANELGSAYDEEKTQVSTKNYIFCRGAKIFVNWDKVVSFDSPDSLRLPEGTYRSYSRKRNPSFIVTHWDATLSAKHCYRILKKRGISTHFSIDNDGTIYQNVDCNDIAWHAGKKLWNDRSIGIDFTNAYYTKYQDWYVKNGHGERPILEGVECHGKKMKPFLGYYPEQIEAYKKLLLALHDHYGIMLEAPEEDGKFVTELYTPAARSKFKGVVSHYHLTKNKIDCAGLDIKKILDEIKEDK